LEPELNGDNTIGCEQLKAFALEFKDVIESLKNEPSLCNVDFDFQAFAKFIENSMIKIPASDRELQALANRSL
jgi:hypothetical protein